MRQIGTIAELSAAERFQDYLIATGTACSLDVADGGYAIWIHDDDRVPTAKLELQQFLSRPDDERYRKARQQADAVLREKAAKRKAARSNIVRMSHNWHQSTGPGPVTVGVVMACVVVFAETFFLHDERGLRSLFFFSIDGTANAILQDGEWWRLLTPSLLHFSPMHIVFNLLMWWQYGGLIEARKGSGTFLFLTLATALATDVLQFAFGSWRFGGMSGVNYGLVGYVFVKGKLDPNDGLGMSRDQAAYAFLFFVICWFSPMVANFGHLGGLVMGVTLGCLSAGWRHWQRQ